MKQNILLLLLTCAVMAMSACKSNAPNVVNASNSMTASNPTKNSIALDLTRPTLVIIYQDHKVIQKQHYNQPGQYTLDTSSLANGEYRLVVRSGGGVSQVVMQQIFTFSIPQAERIHIVMH